MSNQQTPPPNQWTLMQLSFIATSGFSMLLILPVVLGGMVEQLGYTDIEIGRIAAANSLGIALGALYVPLSGNKFQLFKSIQFSLLGLLFIDLACIFIEAPLIYYASRLIAGIFGGIIYAGILRAIAGIPKPEKGYSIYVMVYCFWAAVLFFLAPFVFNTFKLEGLIVHYSVSTIISLLMLPTLRKFQIKSTEIRTDALRYLLKEKQVSGSLLAYLLIMAGCGAIWAYIERIGNQHGFSSEFIGFALSSSNFAGILSGFLVYRIGMKKGLTPPIVLATLCLGLCVIGIGLVPIQGVYFLAIFFLAGAWALTIAYFQKVQATLDVQGKIVALGATVNLFGRAFGQASVGPFLNGANYDPVIWYSLGTYLISLFVVLPIILAIDRRSFSG